MKAEEIRIGNWINTKLYGNFPIVGLNIINNRGTFFKCMEYYPKAASIDRIKPILLTEEWLLKFGFKKFKSKKIWSSKFVIIYYKKDIGYCYGKSSARTTIKHVHQLQNLYYTLTYIDL